MNVRKKDLLVNILKSMEEIFNIYRQSKDMADFHNLQGQLGPLTLNK